jgi:DAK2 domain fusion protein YloV
MPDPSVERAHRVVAVAHAHLEERRQEINDLNVFPVPDGDTGDNMAGTIKAVLAALEGLRASELAAVDRNYIVQTVAHSALMGARGNSGVILSQIVSGAAGVLTTRRGDLIGPALVRDALGAASDAAWASVSEPQEGTMLTVIREVHEAVAAKVAELEETELEAGVSEETQDAMLAELIGVAIAAGLTALDRTTEQLDVLAEAGVVDAGAYGLLIILAGCVAGLAGAELEESPIPHQEAARFADGAHFDSTYKWCTSCIVTGSDLDPRKIAAPLEVIGDSVAVVGDATMVKVHVHTDERERVWGTCEEFGDVDQREATDMHAQFVEIHGGSQEPAASPADGAVTGIVAVASGDGIASLFGAEGAVVVDGGTTMNPSIEEILAGIRSAPGEEVIVLPNSPNVLMAAKQAAQMAERPTHVVEAVAQQAGLAALVGGFDSTAAGSENAERVAAELDAIATGLVAAADRDDGDGRYRRGDAVGFAGDELVAWGDPVETLRGVVARLGDGAEIVTIIEGGEAPAAAAELELELDGAEAEVMDGGQPTYWWLIAAQ